MQENEKRKRTGGRRRRNGKYTLNAALIIFVVIITFAALSVTVLFKLDTVAITGNSIYSPEEILEACGIKSGDNIIRMNMSRRENDIEKKLVYIEKAELKWKHSSTVEINIEPSIEAANLEHENINYLISQNGKILKISDEPGKSLFNPMFIYGKSGVGKRQCRRISA